MLRPWLVVIGLPARWFVCFQVSVRDSLHPIDFDLYVAPRRLRVRHLVYSFLVHLHAVYTEPRSCVKVLVANVALEVLRLLMLDQNLLIVKLPIAVPAPRLGLLLLFPPHFPPQVSACFLL